MKELIDCLHKISRNKKQYFEKYLLGRSKRPTKESDLLRHLIEQSFTWKPVTIIRNPLWWEYEKFLRFLCGAPNQTDDNSWCYNPLYLYLDVPEFYSYYNASLFYLYQNLKLPDTNQRIKSYYQLLQQRNESIHKLVSSSNSEDFYGCHFVIRLPSAKQADFDIVRSRILTMLRNNLKDEKTLWPVKYVWKLQEDGYGYSDICVNGSLSLYIFIKKNDALLVGFGHFLKKMASSIAHLEKDYGELGFNFSYKTLDHSYKEYSPALAGGISKSDLLNLIQEQPIYMATPAGKKRTAFGLGGVGGRKYK